MMIRMIRIRIRSSQAVLKTMEMTGWSFDFIEMRANDKLRICRFHFYQFHLSFIYHAVIFIGNKFFIFHILFIYTY